MPPQSCGGAAADMMQGQESARATQRALKICLHVRPREEVVIVDDRSSPEGAQALAIGAPELGARARRVAVSPLKGSGMEPPEEVADALMAGDVALLVTRHSLTHTGARREASRRGVRIASLPGITEALFITGMDVDFDRLQERTLAWSALCRSRCVWRSERGAFVRRRGRGRATCSPSAAAWAPALSIGEFGIGAHPKIGLTGSTLGDEKMLGTIRVAFGDNRNFAGTIGVHSHIDAVLLRHRLALDGVEIARIGCRPRREGNRETLTHAPGPHARELCEGMSNASGIPGAGRTVRQARQWMELSRSAWARGIGMLAMAALAALGTSARSLAGAGAEATLQANWLHIVASSPTLSHATVSAYAYDLSTHAALAAIHPDQRQTSASLTKLFTSAAALALLGPHFTEQTRVEVPPSVLAGQPGPVYLVGGGDAWLEANGTKGLESLAASVAARIPSATQVVGVSTLFTPPAVELGWPASVLPYSYAAGTSALMAERSEVEVWVQGAATAGSPARVGLLFNSALRDPGYFQIRNQATTAAGGTSRIEISRVLGTNTIVVRGRIAPSAQTAEFLSVHDPAEFAASLFETALAARGVRFEEPATTGVLPAGTLDVAVHLSLPLAHMLKIQNRFSINQMADNLYRMLGVAQGGLGSPAASEAAMGAFLQRAGLGAGPVQVDGSGLSPLDQSSARQVVDLLTYAAAQPWYAAFRQSLLEVGNPRRCGVLCGHMLGTPAVDRVWLKTGNLGNQWNYAGYATARNGDTIAFAILIEGPPTSRNDRISVPLSPIDQMTVDLARWPLESSAARAPVPGQTGSAPAGVAAALRQFMAEPGAVSGGAVIDLQSGRTVWRENGAALIRTGWVPRLALLYAALAQGAPAFGPATVRAAGIVEGSTVLGPVVLDGSGSPQWTMGDWARLASEVRARGITRVTGGVDYVQGADAQLGWLRWPNGAAEGSFGQSWLPPLSRLSIGGDQVTLTLTAPAPGQAVQVAVSPADAPISLQVDAVGVAQGTHAEPVVQLLPWTDSYAVTGTVAVGGPVVVSVAPPDPGQLAAIAFRDALAAAGIAVGSGAVRSVPGSGGGAVLASLPGMGVARLASPLLFTPSSATAAQAGQLLGSRGQRELAAGVGRGDFLPDPTGMAQIDYMTADSVAGLLARAWREPLKRPLVAALGTSALWRVATPEGAAIVGYVRGPHGTPYAVACIESGLPWSGVWAPQFTRIAPVP